MADTSKSARHPTMLVVGSEPYAGLDRNPAAEIARSLDGTELGGVKIAGRVLPVSYRELPARIAALVREHEPVLALGLGLMIGSSTIHVETTALNRADFDMADGEGVFVRNQRIDNSNVEARTATFPVSEIEQNLLARGIPAKISHHAGTHLCNLVLFHLLGAMPAGTSAGFIHIPLLPEQVAHLMSTAAKGEPVTPQPPTELPSMAMELQRQAIMIAVTVMANGLSAE